MAPSANLSGDANDFYDQTAALGLGANFGVLFQTGGRMGFYGQLGLRWMSGMAEIDDLAGTGLEDINNKSSRWTVPVIGGVRRSVLKNGAPPSVRTDRCQDCQIDASSILFVRCLNTFIVADRFNRPVGARCGSGSGPWVRSGGRWWLLES